MSTYTHTSPESPSYTASLYSYFSLGTPDETPPLWPGRLSFPTLSSAVYAFTLSPDNSWAQLALQGSLVKLSLRNPRILKATVPCFERRDFVRLKKEKLDELAKSGSGEMIWINERRGVGVWTRVIERTILGIEDGFRNQIPLNRVVPVYPRQQGEAIKYTIGFDYLALKTGYMTLRRRLMVDFCLRN